MSRRAHVDSIDSLRSLRASLQEFADIVREALISLQMEVQRVAQVEQDRDDQPGDQDKIDPRSPARFGWVCTPLSGGPPDKDRKSPDNHQQGEVESASQLGNDPQ